MHTPEDLINEVMKLSPGDMVVIPCIGYDHMNSTRMAIYRQRQKLRAISKEFADEIVISSSTREDRYSVIIYKVPTINAPYILRQDGSIETIGTTLSEEDELIRIADMMEQDGFTPEAIAQFKIDFRSSHAVTTSGEGDSNE